VGEKNNQRNPAEEEQSAFSDNEPTFPQRDDVDGVNEDNEVEARTEDRLGDGDSAQMPVPQQTSYEPAALSAISTMQPEVASALAEAEARRAEAAESSRAEAELRFRELEMKGKQAEWEAARQQSQLEAQVQLEMERSKQEAEARKAEATQLRERNKQQFELQKNKWSIDKMRGLVSLLLVAGFLATTGVVILLNATGQAEAEMLQTVASLYSGITGAVLGFYFGRQQQ
jgi:hypothetical protein